MVSKKMCLIVGVMTLIVGVVSGLLVSPSLWRGVAKGVAASSASKEQVIAVAKKTMADKTVCLVGEDQLASAAANTMVSLGAKYAPKDKADYLISGKYVSFTHTDLDFLDRAGNLLHRVSVSEKKVAEDEAVWFAWSLGQPS